MASNQFTIIHTSPSPQEFVQLREKIGWGKTDVKMAEMSLRHSLFHVIIRQHSKLIAMGRVIGDGALFFYIQDVVVDPDFQQQGLGHIVMENIERYLLTVTKKGATVGLLAAQGKEHFYRRYGYLERTGNELGKGMCKFV